MEPYKDTTSGRKVGLIAVLIVLFGGLLLFLSWVFRFPWDFPGP
jgi:hypothetical protein